MYEDGDWGNLAEGTSKVDLMGLCLSGYGEFLSCPMRMFRIGMTEG